MSDTLDNSYLLKENKKNDTVIMVSDKFHTYIRNNFSDNQQSFVILNEIIFYGAFVYYYYFGPIHDSNQTFIIVKYILIILALRYLFSYITSYTLKKDIDKEVSNFQINSKIAIFSILIIFLTKEHQIENTTSIILILIYTLISSAAQYGYTIDNIMTVLIIYCLFKSNLIN
jgi:hypothetical protein